MATENKDPGITVDFNDKKKQQAFDKTMEELQHNTAAIAELKQTKNPEEAFKVLNKYYQVDHDEYMRRCNRFAAQLKNNPSGQAGEGELQNDELDMAVGGNGWTDFWHDFWHYFWHGLIDKPTSDDNMEGVKQHIPTSTLGSTAPVPGSTSINWSDPISGPKRK